MVPFVDRRVLDVVVELAVMPPLLAREAILITNPKKAVHTPITIGVA
jgi:hypothetical protein